MGQASSVHAGRYTHEHDGDVVVFLIGMRVNRLAKVRSWLPVARAMGPMLRELGEHPELGLLGAEFFRRGRTVLFVQYWRSFADLERFARSPDLPHLPAWRAYNKAVGSSGVVGVYHETYVVPAGSHESLYANMPAFGLAKATAHVPVARRGQAAGYRMGVTADDRPAEPVPV